MKTFFSLAILVTSGIVQAECKNGVCFGSPSHSTPSLTNPPSYPPSRPEPETLDWKLVTEVNKLLSSFAGNGVEAEELKFDDEYVSNDGLRAVLAGLQEAHKDLRSTLKEFIQKHGCKTVKLRVSNHRTYGDNFRSLCSINLDGSSMSRFSPHKERFEKLSQGDVIRRQLALARALRRAGDKGNIFRIDGTTLWLLPRKSFDTLLAGLPAAVARLAREEKKGKRVYLSFSEYGPSSKRVSPDSTVYSVNVWEEGISMLKLFSEGNDSDFVIETSDK